MKIEKEKLIAWIVAAPIIIVSMPAYLVVSAIGWVGTITEFTQQIVKNVADEFDN